MISIGWDYTCLDPLHSPACLMESRFSKVSPDSGRTGSCMYSYQVSDVWGSWHTINGLIAWFGCVHQCLQLFHRPSGRTERHLRKVISTKSAAPDQEMEWSDCGSIVSCQLRAWEMWGVVSHLLETSLKDIMVAKFHGRKYTRQAKFGKTIITMSIRKE